MRVFVLASKFWSFSQVLYRGIHQEPDTVSTHLCKSRTLHIAIRCYILKMLSMYLWPFKHCRIDTSLSREKILERMDQHTDQDYKSIYWGKRFYKRFFGRVGENAFKVRPVVPYWNISPVEIKGYVDEQAGGGSLVECRLSCPYLRVVVPLVLLAVVLFLINYIMSGSNGGAMHVMALIVVGAYALVNVPFQIQANRDLRDLKGYFEGKVRHLR